MWFQDITYKYIFFHVNDVLSTKHLYPFLDALNSSKGRSVPNYGKIIVKSTLEHMFLYNFSLIFCKNRLKILRSLQKIRLGCAEIPIIDS